MPISSSTGSVPTGNEPFAAFPHETSASNAKRLRWSQRINPFYLPENIPPTFILPHAGWRSPYEVFLPLDPRMPL